MHGTVQVNGDSAIDVACEHEGEFVPKKAWIRGLD